jgi:hypothetical protein
VELRLHRYHRRRIHDIRTYRPIPYQVSHGAVAEWVGTYFSGFELFPYVAKFYGDPGTIVSVTNACNAVTCSIENPGVTLVQRSAGEVGCIPRRPDRDTRRSDGPRPNRRLM